jgi:hypothetical protein
MWFTYYYCITAARIISTKRSFLFVCQLTANRLNGNCVVTFNTWKGMGWDLDTPFYTLKLILLKTKLNSLTGLKNSRNKFKITTFHP